MKTAIPINRHKFQKCLEQAEQNGPLENRTLLWQKITELYNLDEDKKQLTTSIAYLRFKQFKLTCKTPVGKKGRVGGVPFGARTKKKTPKSEKFAQSKTLQEHFKILRNRTPEKYQHLVDKIKKGSRTASQKLHCLECSDYQSKEVAECTVIACPSYAFRPYQKSDEGSQNDQD